MTLLSKEMLAWGREVLASQPFSVLLGAELLDLAEGRAALKILIRAELKQQHGFVHGGVVSYVADNALTYAGGSVLGPGVVTSEFKINYVRPAMGEFIVPLRDGARHDREAGTITGIARLTLRTGFLT